jgi:hypothetical protein
VFFWCRRLIPTLKFPLELVSVVLDMLGAMGRQFAPTGITTIIRMPARLMDITAHSGSMAESLSEQVHGSAAAMATAAGVTAVAGMETGMIGVIAADMDMGTAATVAGVMAMGESLTAEAITVVVDTAVVVVSTVVAGAADSTAAADMAVVATSSSLRMYEKWLSA